MNHDELIPLDSNRQCTRRHAIKVFGAAAGGAVLSQPLAQALAELPWGEEEQSTMLSDGGQGVRCGKQHTYPGRNLQNSPTLVLDAHRNQLWTTWTRRHKKHERIWARSFSIANESWGDPIAVSDENSCESYPAHQSTAILLEDRLLVAWNEYGPSGWTLRTRTLNTATGQLGQSNSVTQAGQSGECHFEPTLAACNNSAILVWQNTPASGSPCSILGLRMSPDGTGIGKHWAISNSHKADCRRPTAAISPDGSTLAVAYDVQEDPGTQNIHLTLLNAHTGELSRNMRVSSHPASDIAPSLAYSPKGDLLWISWHTNRAIAPDNDRPTWDIPRSYMLRALRTGDHTWQAPTEFAATSRNNEQGTIQGFEFPQVIVSPNSTVCITGRPSHSFCLQYYSNTGRSPMYRVPRDGWGGRGQHLVGVFDTEGNLWLTRRDLDCNILQKVEGFADVTGPPSLKPADEHRRYSEKPLQGIQPRIVWPQPSHKHGQNDPSRFNLYFGDIHGHSWQSDGMGDPNESYLRARDIFRDDFHVLTDHDNFVGKRLLNGEWQQQKDIADHYNAPEQFATLFGQEWTSPRINAKHGWGHFIVYSADPAIPLFDHKDERFRDLPQLISAARSHQAIMIPHHIGWTGVKWETWDDEVIPAVEICSVHGAFEYEGNTPITHRGGIAGSFVRDGLARGIRLGLAGGSDQHGLTWQHGVCWKRNVYRAGLTGVWAKQLTRESILDAFRARRTFATTGVKLCPRFYINGQALGASVETNESPQVKVDVSIPPDQGALGRIELVRNGQVIHTYGGEGQRSRYSYTDSSCPFGGTSYYYLRITLKDNNMAWTSPIWVNRV